MSKTTKIALFLLLVVLGAAGYLFQSIQAHDSRSARSLSAYCNIDFRGVRDLQSGSVVGATLSIVDFRYAPQPLDGSLVVAIDGDRRRIDAVNVAQTPPVYSPSRFGEPHAFQHGNTLFVSFPPQLLPEIAHAKHVTIAFRYVGSLEVELPLSEPDLQYWKNQLPGL